MAAIAARTDYAALSERMSHLLALRAAIAVIVVAWSLFRPTSVGIELEVLLAAAVGYLVLAVVAEVVRRRLARFGYGLLTALLLIDGLFLAFAMYATGGTQSPFRFLVYLHLVAVSLLVSYRTGLKIALWHSLLLFVVLYAQAALLIPALEVTPGAAVEFDRLPVLNVTAFWLFAIATSVFSALNERELRLRRADLQLIVDIGARLDDLADPVEQSAMVLDSLIEHLGSSRGVVLGASDGRVLVLADRGTTTPPTAASDADWIVRRAWERRSVLPVSRLDPTKDPFLSKLLPSARNLLVAPMIADGRAIGAIVVEYRARRLSGVERRVAAMLAQVASLAALNLRNAVLLRHVQDLAERDSLTGAANRRMFQRTLERVLDRGRDPVPDGMTAVLFIDLDDFKVVNDTLGHAVGDALLVAVTERISGLVRESDLVARLGGDEFAILTDDDADLHRARAMAERLVDELRKPYVLGDRHVIVTSSIGIASARDALDGAGDLVRNADAAMYLAKANGKSGFAVFDPEMQEAIRERHMLTAQLQRAVELGQLRLVYQPIVDFATGAIAGLEALVRWQHPEFGLVMPGRFIELAEESGAIVPIGHWVLSEACETVSRWLADGVAPADLFVGVNVSAREVQQPGFVDGVRTVLARTCVDPGTLILEITETALLRATPATIATLDELRGLGVRTVIDDFGTGYFSLSHLRQFPIDVIKVAREFVQDEDPDSKSSLLAGTIVAMGRSLGIATVAEGIETADQADRMRALGCTY
ncbi:MAG TPA: EAL domain-containing protein, partial [Candidatus Binatia bacterium]|nr:EAL domain-containing protein [Candidatus Binatia bacterium]